MADSDCHSGRRGFPARPGQRQFAFEPPRTIRKTDIDSDALGQLNPDWVETLMGLEVGWTGLTGRDSRADRIELCGNGVVPPQAKLAIETLLDRLE